MTPPTKSDDPRGREAGWHPDPWTPSHYRYWNGTSWTADHFPVGPSTTPADDRGHDAAFWGPATSADPPPPTWRPAAKVAEAPLDQEEATVDDPGPAHPRWMRLAAIAAAAFLLAGSSFVVARHRLRDAAAPVTSPQTTPTTGPVATTTGNPILARLVVNRGDVAAGVAVEMIQAGDQTTEPTLDLCNGTFPSETSRTARLQVAAADASGTAFLSTEAVLYSSVDVGAQAMGEIRSVAAACPAKPVESPVGEATATTTFNRAPDDGWPQVATVDRAAFDFTSTDDSGGSRHTVAVYLRRGRVLMGLYFPDGTPPPVDGQSSVAAIVNVFANRMAHLSSADANGIA